MADGASGATTPPKPLLVLGWGNRSRGDDALAPLLLDALARAMSPAQAARVELLEAHQLSPELALDLAWRECVLLVDADRAAVAPFVVKRLAPERDASPASHTLSPQSLLAVYATLHGREAPPTLLLGLAAQHFGLGEPLSATAADALPAALRWALAWIDGDGTGPVA
jgi:hydrogenase maturation protease